MPELPEVQTVVNGLKKKIVGKKIVGVSYCDAEKLIKSPSFKEFKKKVAGQVIEKIERRAKNIFVYLSSGDIMHFHLKMSGHLMVIQDLKLKMKNYSMPSGFIKEGRWQGGKLPEELRDPYNQYIHLVIDLSDDTILAMSDLRKFGTVQIVGKDFVSALDKSLGPEPLNARILTLERFSEILGASTGPIKRILLDQSRIAGIGNIYGDEILFRAGIRPDRGIKKLKKEEIKKIWENISPVLKEAIRLGGTTIGDFRNTDGRRGGYQDSRMVYGRVKEKCKVCDTIIERIKINNRSAYFCHKCQK